MKLQKSKLLPGKSSNKLGNSRDILMNLESPNTPNEERRSEKELSRVGGISKSTVPSNFDKSGNSDKNLGMELDGSNRRKENFDVNEDKTENPDIFCDNCMKEWPIGEFCSSCLEDMKTKERNLALDEVLKIKKEIELKPHSSPAEVTFDRASQIYLLWRKSFLAELESKIKGMKK